MQSIEIIGHLGANPEMRYMEDGQPLTDFRVAANRRYTTRDGEQREDTSWYTVQTRGRTAETCNEFLSTGRQVFVRGSPSLREWQTDDGRHGADIEIYAFDVQFLGGGRAKTSRAATTRTAGTATNTAATAATTATTGAAAITVTATTGAAAGISISSVRPRHRAADSKA